MNILAANQVSIDAMLANMRPKGHTSEPAKAMVAPQLPFDPIERAAWIESQIMHGEKRKYYRFRCQTKWWAPVVCDSSGCCLQCAYCWNAGRNASLPGSFMEPEKVAAKLNAIAHENHEWNFRTGGCEPILGEASTKHLARLIEASECSRFLIESNGVVLGENLELLDLLEPYKNIIWLRISAKADNAERFEKISGANADFFDRPFKACHEANRRGFDVALAYMPDFTNEEKLRRASGWNGVYDGEGLHLYRGTKALLIERKCWDLQYSTNVPKRPCWITSEKDGGWGSA